MHLSKLARRATRTLIDTALPPLCPGCDRELQGTRWICGACRRKFRAVPDRPLCLACRIEDRKTKGREAGFYCSVHEHAQWKGRAAFWMEPPLDNVLHRLKYSGCPHLARPLARLAAQRIAAPHASGITGVPLFRSRRRERGYNQADLLARELAVLWGVPFVSGVLERRRSTKAQATLDETARATNVAGAFHALEPTWVSGRFWVVTDDILTTGQTLFECLEVLRQGGASGAMPMAVALA